MATRNFMELFRARQAGKNSKGGGMIINASRSIIFASSGPDFAQAARAATLKLHNEITIALSCINA